MKKTSAAVVRSWATRKQVPKIVKLCDFKGCKSVHKAHGLCARHGAQMRRGTIRADALNEASQDNGTLARTPADGPCRRCGCPTTFGLCLLCMPIRDAAYTPVVIVENILDTYYHGAIWQEPKKKRTRRKYPYSGRSISRNL